MPILTDGDPPAGLASGRGNRLLSEPSPYLRLHAHNPVDWYPWGEEAFAKAREENKPIFLSIGYYTCHWCHVMERESFADLGIAAKLNRDFVAIKIDREERPDIDRLYMAFVQATTGMGGWPLSVFLTPRLEPFFGGTYFAPTERRGSAGFATVLESIAQSWREQREQVIDSAQRVTATLRERLAAGTRSDAATAAAITDTARMEAVWEGLFQSLADSYDPVQGGFGAEPKFPRPVNLHFLLRYARRGLRGKPSEAKRERALRAQEMALKTLAAMADGGICDQLGGGFHRYSTDDHWRVPHFEKMLYDQAQLAIAYLEAWQLTQASFYATIARETLDYVLREMVNEDGAFYSAQDADSEVPLNHRTAASPPSEAAPVGEGAFYVWTLEEVQTLLGSPAAELVARHFNLRPEGNVRRMRDPHGEFAGRNILYVHAGDEELAQEFGRDADTTIEMLELARKRMLAERRRRPWPPTDDKVLTAWNGLMISAFAKGAAAFGDPRYLAAARDAARFLEDELYDADRRQLYRRWHNGERAIAGFLEDYAFLIQGLLDLYEADFDPHWVEWAQTLQQAQDNRFYNAATGYLATENDPHLWVRMREDYDGAEPSANSVTASNLLRLVRSFGDHSGWRERAEHTLALVQERLRQSPEALPLMAAAWELAVTAPQSVVVAGDPKAPETQAMLAQIRRRFLPHLSVHLAAADDWQGQRAHWAPQLAAIAPPPAGAAAYWCDRHTCQAPVTDLEELAALLEGPRALG